MFLDFSFDCYSSAGLWLEWKSSWGRGAEKCICLSICLFLWEVTVCNWQIHRKDKLQSGWKCFLFLFFRGNAIFLFLNVKRNSTRKSEFCGNTFWGTKAKTRASNQKQWPLWKSCHDGCFWFAITAQQMVQDQVMLCVFPWAEGKERVWKGWKRNHPLRFLKPFFLTTL